MGTLHRFIGIDRLLYPWLRGIDCLVHWSSPVRKLVFSQQYGPVRRSSPVRKIVATILYTITAQLMSEVCPNVATEHTQQPVSNERFFIALQILSVVLALMRGLRVFGAFIINKPTLMFVFSTLWLLRITRLTFLLASDLMIVRNVGCMNSESVKLSVDHLPPLFFQL